MTAINWLIEELKKVHHPTEAMIMYAKKLEKQQILDAHKNGEYLIPNIENAELYYTSTYGSKGSDATSSQTEISDEEIEKRVKEVGAMGEYYKMGYRDAIKWYREQLKTKA